MKLKEYFQKNHLSQAAFARKIGISRAYLCNILKGNRTPSLPLAKIIQDSTEGDVSLDDLFNPKAPSRLQTKKKKKTENT